MHKQHAEAPTIGGFAVGDTVSVTCPGHRHDGRTGTVSYLGELFVTVGVSIEGQDYGFFAAELTAAPRLKAKRDGSDTGSTPTSGSD